MSRFIKYPVVFLLLLIFISAALLYAVRRENSAQQNVAVATKLTDEAKNAAFNKVFCSMDTLFMNFITMSKYDVKLKLLDGDSLSHEALMLTDRLFVQLDSLLSRNYNIILDLKSDMGALETMGFDNSFLRENIARFEAYNHQLGSEIGLSKETISHIPVLMSEVRAVPLADNRQSDSSFAVRMPKKINRAYYVVDNKWNLIRNGIIKCKYLLFGDKSINQTTKLNLLDTIDMMTVRNIPIGKKGVEMISSHPEGSYRLIFGKNKNLCTELEITNPNRFWSQSKVLVVSYKN